MLLLTYHVTCGQWKLSPADGFGSLVGHKFVMLSFLPLVFRPQIIIIIIIVSSAQLMYYILKIACKKIINLSFPASDVLVHNSASESKHQNYFLTFSPYKCPIDILNNSPENSATADRVLQSAPSLGSALLSN